MSMDAPADEALMFTLDGGATTGAPSSVLGLWSVGTRSGVIVPAFSAEAAVQPGDILWQADLPASPMLAANRLANAEASLSAYPWAMATAHTRLAGYAARRQAGGGFAFDGSAEAAQPERVLDSLLLEICQAVTPASFGLGETIGDMLARTGEQFQAFLEQLERQLTHYAWVETRSQGQLLACTVVGWRGDARTYWREGIAPSRTALHRRTVALALGSRLRLLETLAFVSRNAVRLARLPVLLSLPGGAILALPLAWKFVDDVRKELVRP